jgi:hypothetical protein
MPEFFLTDNNPQRAIDLGKSQVLTVTNFAHTAVKVHIDYTLPNGQSSSAVRAGYGANPFTLQPAETNIVPKANLESEHVTVGVDGDGANVRFRY